MPNILWSKLADDLNDYSNRFNIIIAVIEWSSIAGLPYSSMPLSVVM